MVLKKMKVAFFGILWTISTSVLAASDTLFIQTLVPNEVVYGRSSFSLKPGQYLALSKEKYAHIFVGGAEITMQPGMELLIVVNDNELLRYTANDNTTTNQLTKKEFFSYWNAVKFQQKSVWLKHLSDFSASVLERPSYLSIQALIMEEKLSLFTELYNQKNFIAAAEVLQSLNQTSLWDTSLKQYRSALAHYLEVNARKESLEKRHQTALSLMNKAMDLEPTARRKDRSDSIAMTMRSLTYNDILASANAMTKSSKQKALGLYEEANRIFETDSLKAKINVLKSMVEDSIYQQAKLKDHNRTMIQYRIVEYENYLQQYPEGNYVQEASHRMQKLTKISGQLERNFITYGRIFWNDGRQGNQIRIGRFSERNVFSFVVALSDDVLALRQSPYSIDRDKEIKKVYYRLAEVPEKSYDQAHFVTRGNYMASYARLIGKPRVFQYYILVDVGIADRYAYYLTRDLGSHILDAKPEETPKYRRYTTEDAIGYAGGLSLLLNYKLLTLEAGTRLDNFGYGYVLSVGISL